MIDRASLRHQSPAPGEATEYRGGETPEWRCRAALVVGAVVALLVLARCGRGLTFFFDEWNFLLDRRDLSAGSLFEPHNGHLSTLPVLAYQILMRTAGMSTYWPYLAMIFALHIVIVFLLYALVRRRASGSLALVSALALLFLGRAWQDLIWPFQIGFLGSLAFGLAALRWLERGPAGDRLVSAALAGSLACSGLGLPVAVAVAVEVLLSRGWRSVLRVMAAPGLAYALWYLWRGGSDADIANFSLVPGYVARSAAGAVGALGGVDRGLAANVAALAASALVLGLLVLRRGTPRMAGAAAGLVVFWSLTSLTRGQYGEPSASRYLYPGALFTLLALAEAAVVVGRGRSRWLPLVLCPFLVWGSWANTDLLRRAGSGQRSDSTFLRAELAALELLAGHAPPDFRPDRQRAPQLQAGPYLAAVNDLDSPAARPAKLPGMSAEVREAADGVMLRILQQSGLVRHGRASAGDGCRTIAVGGGRPREIVLTGPAVVRPLPGTRPGVWLRRFADSYETEPLFKLDSGLEATLDLPPDESNHPWRLHVETEGGYRLCQR